MRHLNKVTAQQAELFMNTHFGHNIKKIEVLTNRGKRIEFFARGICVGSFISAFGILEYLIH
ncbi:MAG: hypothetical protein IT212_07735 [Bacteroidia bacterium]|nr:hypothetical protein [Bacteroidia bacterium]